MKNDPWWPRGWGEWFQAATILFIFLVGVVPSLVYYWQGIQRMGGFWTCLWVMLNS